jgi:hypothetical protein
MLWAALVAGGVAIVSMAIFGARLTRTAKDEPDEIVPAADTDDPWAAWRPRPFDELDNAQRPRVWPVLASLTGLILVGGGLAGARQSFEKPEALAAADSTPEPFTIEVEVTPTPTPAPTATPTPAAKPAATAKSQAASQKPSTAAAAAPGPKISGSSSCTNLAAKVVYTVTPLNNDLSWVSVYMDGKLVKGGATGQSGHSGSYEHTTTAGAHTFEVAANDKAGHTSRKQFSAHC